MTAYLCPAGPTGGPSSVLLNFYIFEHWNVLDDCPSRDKFAVNRHLGSLVTVQIYMMFSIQSSRIGPLILWPKRERPNPPRPASSWRQECGDYGLEWRDSCPAVAYALRVERSRNGCPNSKSVYFTCESTSLRTTVELRRLYNMITKRVFASLFGRCACPATRLRKAETMGSLVSTEPDKPTPRHRRYGGRGANVVYRNNLVLTALADSSVTCIVEVWLCRAGVCILT